MLSHTCPRTKASRIPTDCAGNTPVGRFEPRTCRFISLRARRRPRVRNLRASAMLRRQCRVRRALPQRLRPSLGSVTAPTARTATPHPSCARACRRRRRRPLHRRCRRRLRWRGCVVEHAPHGLALCHPHRPRPHTPSASAPPKRSPQIETTSAQGLAVSQPTSYLPGHPDQRN